MCPSTERGQAAFPALSQHTTEAVQDVNPTDSSSPSSTASHHEGSHVCKLGCLSTFVTHTLRSQLTSRLPSSCSTADDPTPPTEPFLLTFLSHLTSTTADESFPIPSTAAQAPILPRRPTAGAVATLPALPYPLQPQPCADLPAQPASAADVITEVAAAPKLPAHDGVTQKKAPPSSAHDCCAAPVLPMLQQGRGSRGGSQHGTLAGLMGLGLRRHVGSGASSNGMQAGGLAGPMGDEDAHTNRFAR